MVQSARRRGGRSGTAEEGEIEREEGRRERKEGEGGGVSERVGEREGRWVRKIRREEEDRKREEVTEKRTNGVRGGSLYCMTGNDPEWFGE